MADIDAKTALRLVQGGEALLVDVRSAGEFASGHAPEAIHVTLGQLSPKALPNLAGRKVVLICASGMRSSAGCDLLEPHGIEAYSVTGGMSAWQRAGGTTIREAGAAQAQQGKLMAIAVVVLGLVLSALVHPGFLVLTAIAAAHLFKMMLPQPAPSTCASAGPGQTACSTPDARGKTSGCSGCGARNAG